MSASTEALLLYGAISENEDVEDWGDMEDDHGAAAKKRGLRFGHFSDGDISGYYLAVSASIVQVDAGLATFMKPTKLQASPLWQQKIEDFAQEILLSFGKVGWYLICSTDRDY